MSDHVSGPRAAADPACDITDFYAFISPDRAGHLVMVMCVFGRANMTTLFSDSVTYRFRLRPVTVAATGPAAKFAVSEREFTFDCTFDVPVQQGGSTVQTGAVASHTGASASFIVNDENGGEGNGLRAFAGVRTDPFIFEALGTRATLTNLKLAFLESGRSNLDGLNCLSVVLEVECATQLGDGPLFAVIAETLSAGEHPVRLERQGRAEVKNFSMSTDFYGGRPEVEIRDRYNDEDAFAVRPEALAAFRERLNRNHALFDLFDGKVDWPPNEHGDHPLTMLLLDDFLVVDISKPFSEESYFEIEQSMLNGQAHTTSGGRALNDDMMDTYWTLLTNNGNGPRVTDGVTQNAVPATYVFPYVGPPNQVQAS